MNSFASALTVFTCVFGGALFGMFLRRFVLPEYHLTPEAKSTVQLTTALIVTLAAMVLSLLIASARAFYDTQTTELTDLSANVILLDRTLAHYGSDAQPVRVLLRSTVAHVIDQMWSKDSSGFPRLDPKSTDGELVYDKIQQLSPSDDVQRQLKDQALGIAKGLGQVRWLMYEQRAHSIPMALLVVLVFWLVAIFISFGLFAPQNGTVLTSLLIAASAVSGAILLLLDMYSPYSGLIQISSAPLRAALNLLDQ